MTAYSNVRQFIPTQTRQTRGTMQHISTVQAPGTWIRHSG